MTPPPEASPRPSPWKILRDYPPSRMTGNLAKAGYPITERMSESEANRRLNAHDALVAALEKIEKRANGASYRMGEEMAEIARTALSAAKRGE